MKKLILISALFLSSNGWADGLDLVCGGVATIKNYGKEISTGTIGTGIDSTKIDVGTYKVSKNNVQVEVIISFDDDFGSGTIQIPSSMRPPANKKKGKFELTKITANDDEISAQFKINFLNKPKFTISRITGTLDYSGTGASLNAPCEQVDIAKIKRKF